ncbi:hypothetical protein BC830DRAFT_1174986 [Chytriomyces sp. MP71]|nr:hypothetical protein BC830DRAFT_1174986 [Chytriomyces sp. MP71]
MKLLNLVITLAGAFAAPAAKTQQQDQINFLASIFGAILSPKIPPAPQFVAPAPVPQTKPTTYQEGQVPKFVPVSQVKTKQNLVYAKPVGTRFATATATMQATIVATGTVTVVDRTSASISPSTLEASAATNTVAIASDAIASSFIETTQNGNSPPVLETTQDAVLVPVPQTSQNAGPSVVPETTQDAGPTPAPQTTQNAGPAPAPQTAQDAGPALVPQTTLPPNPELTSGTQVQPKSGDPCSDIISIVNSYPRSSNNPGDALALHNSIRSYMGLSSMFWDDAIANQATVDAKYSGDHGSCHIPQLFHNVDSGVVTAAMSLGWGSFVDAINQFVTGDPHGTGNSECSDYFNQRPNYKKSHFYSIVHPAISKMGCGLWACPSSSDVIIGCDYSF